MNAARLKALIEDLLAAEEQFKIQDQLSNLASALQNFVGQPQDSNMQVEVSKKLNSLASQMAKLEGRWEPVQLADLESIGALPFFSEAMVDGIKQSIAGNSMTPAVVHKHVQQLAKKREQYLEVLLNSNRDLQTLGIGAETLDEGTAEIGFRIPRLLFDDNLEGLISELNVLRRIMRAFSELATGSAEPIAVRQISTSDPLFFFGLDAITIGLLGCVVTWALDTWERAEKIRKLRTEARSLEPSDDDIEKFFGSKIDQMVKEAIEEKTTELIGTDKPTGRKAELRNDLDWALESLLARIERGMTVEIRFLPPPAPAEDKANDPKTQKLREAFDIIKETAPKLSFPPPDPNPVLQLPSNKPPSATTNDGKTAKKTPKAT